MHCCPGGPWYQKVSGPPGCGFCSSAELDDRVRTGGGEAGVLASATRVEASFCAGRTRCIAMCAPATAWFGATWLENSPIRIVVTGCRGGCAFTPTALAPKPTTTTRHDD